MPHSGDSSLAVVPDTSTHFVRFDRDGPGSEGRHYVIHAADPKFVLELSPDPRCAAGSGVIRRLSVPNSWAGDYGRYARLLSQAQEFFSRAGGPRAPR